MKRATRKEFQEWLNQFPEDTLIEIAIQEEPSAYQSYGPVSFKPFMLNKVADPLSECISDSGHGWNYSNFTNNSLIKEDSYWYGKHILELGETP